MNMALPFRRANYDPSPVLPSVLDKLVDRMEMLTDSIDRLTENIQTLNERLKPSEPVCSHPLDQRTDFSVMGQLGRFECSRSKGGCGYRNF